MTTLFALLLALAPFLAPASEIDYPEDFASIGEFLQAVERPLPHWPCAGLLSQLHLYPALSAQDARVLDWLADLAKRAPWTSGRSTIRGPGRYSGFRIYRCEPYNFLVDFIRVPFSRQWRLSHMIEAGRLPRPQLLAHLQEHPDLARFILTAYLLSTR